MKGITQTFNISFPRALVTEIDSVAKEQFASRSDFLRTAALQYLRNEEEWKELFNYGKKIGIEAKSQSEEEVAESITALRRESRR